MEDWRVAWIALSLTRHIGGKTLRALLAYFDDDPLAILDADSASLQRVRGVGTSIAKTITQLDLQRVRKAVERWQQAGVHIVTTRDDTYPRALLRLDDEPPTLFVRGQWPMPARPAVAIVGTRRVSTAGAAGAYSLAINFARAGGIVISGLAYGVDGIAHRGALQGDSKYTLAVLGSGILNIYPPEHGELAKIIQQHGALLCEVAPNATVSTSGLVARNRIIVGLSQAVILVESEINGGAMHAARRALKLGIPLYVFDKPLSGNQYLLENGAKPVPSDWDLDWHTWAEQLLLNHPLSEL